MKISRTICKGKGKKGNGCTYTRKMGLKRNMRVEAAVGADRADMEEFVRMQMRIGNGLDEAGLSSNSFEISLEMLEEGVAPRPNAHNLHHNYPVEYLNSPSFSGLPPYKLRLKIGCIVMLLRNLDLKQGLRNGVRLRVLEIVGRR